MLAHRPTVSAPAFSYLACVIGLGLCLALPALAQQPASAPAPETAEVQRLLKDGQHAQALKLIDESLAKNPKDPQMRFRRGVALSMLDRKAEALTVFQKLVEDHPEMPAPYNNMAVIYGAQGEYDKARGSLERAIRTNPAYATAYQNLGDVYAQLASQAYSKALQLDKSDATVPPKLALLRELTAGPNVPPTASVTVAAAPTKREPSGSPASVPSLPATPTVKPTNPAPVAASKPTPTPTPPPAVERPAANAIGDVEGVVKAWASAWARRDMSAYYSAYAPDYAGQSGSRKAWEQERRDRIANRKNIKVEVSNLRVSVTGDKATARFRQSYESDSLSVVSSKTLQLIRGASGKWVIRQESVGG